MRCYRADLHIHSVLSPCGGLEMAPSAVVNKLLSSGIEWFAITDHNSMANCPAYEAVARKAGLHFSWGVEIQSMEEIHILAYFDDPKMAQDFDRELYGSLLPIANDPDYFGDQVIIDENENILKVEPLALINSSMWDLSTVVERIQAFGGFAVPAHIDATVNSVISQLGFLPPQPEFKVLGISAKLDLQDYLSQHPHMIDKQYMRASDAHYLADLGHTCCRAYVQSASVKELMLAADKLDGRYIDSLNKN